MAEEFRVGHIVVDDSWVPIAEYEEYGGGTWSFRCPACGVVTVTPAGGNRPETEAEYLAVRAEHLKRHHRAAAT